MSIEIIVGIVGVVVGIVGIITTIISIWQNGKKKD